MTEQDIDTVSAAEAAAENEAREYGWSAKDNWRGDPDAWMPASAFLKKTKQTLPIVNSLLNKERAERKKDREAYEARTKDFESRQKDFERKLEAQTKASERMLDMQRAQLLEEFEARKRAALAIEDPKQRQDAYDHLSRQERETIKQFTAAAEPPREAQRQPERQEQQQQPQMPKPVQEALAGFMTKHQWANDPELRAIAGSIPVPINVNSDPEGHFDFIAKRMATLFPERCGGAKTEKPVQRTVEDGGETDMRGSNKPKSKGWQHLPADVKSACERLIASGRLKGDPKAVKDAYAETYWSEYGE